MLAARRARPGWHDESTVGDEPDRGEPKTKIVAAARREQHGRRAVAGARNPHFARLLTMHERTIPA